MPTTSPRTEPTDRTAAQALDPYDAVLLLSFGGPDGPEDVMPFLRNVTAGRNIPDARLEQVAEHYHHFGGVSPINAQNKALLAALRAELETRGVDTPLLWGNRNWAPFTLDALTQAQTGGARRVLALFTSAYSSYSGCRQYREDLWQSLDALAAQVGGPGAEHPVQVDKVRAYFNHPGFTQAATDAVVDAYTAHPEVAAGARLVFVTHSVPTTMDEASAVSGASYTEQHRDVAAVVAAAAGERLGRTLDWDLAFCSRSGPPHQPWLEPDVNDHLRGLAADGTTAVVLAPIGFVSDHMEVVYDLDTEALATAAELGLTAVRADTVGVRAPFVAGLVDLLLERAAHERARAAGEEPTPGPVVGELGPWSEVCRPGCCLQRAGAPSGLPAACSADPLS